MTTLPDPAARPDRSGDEHEGVVTAFDEAVGLGVITAHNGAQVPFHCIAIADGTRRIDPGVEVRFQLLPKLGRYEATAVTPR